MQLFVTPLAEQDLEDIGDYIALDNPSRAMTFVQELYEHCQKICLNPDVYRRRPELADSIRSCAHGNYVIFFEATAVQVNIIRVLNGARDISQPLDLE